MAKIIPQTPKGFRDFLPAEDKIRRFVLSHLSQVFESFGFEPLETSSIEYAETLKGKYGEEEKLIYKFTDRGERQIALRYDQTVPLARVVGQYKEIPKPFKRYQMQNVWRAENPQKGRFREFIQVDLDTVGTSSLLADSEIIAIIIASLKSLGLKDFKVYINDRTIFEDLSLEAIRSLDKLRKIGWEKVKEELKEKGLTEADIKKVEEVKNAKSTPGLKEIFSYLKMMGVEEKYYEFDPTLARGLDYYTGPIWETFIEGYLPGAVCSGGRYDQLIGIFSKQEIPATGTSFGFDRLLEALKEFKLLPEEKSSAKVLVTVFKEKLLSNSLWTASQLREANIKTEVYLDPKARLDKQLKYADNKKIPFALIIGTEEIEKGEVTLKDLTTGKQQKLNFKDLFTALR